MLKKLMTGAAVLALSTTAAAADALDTIAERGKIVVGVKADYAPWGMRDAAGNLVGMEHDMIDDFVKRVSAELGKPIELEKIVVVASNRMEFQTKRIVAKSWASCSLTIILRVSPSSPIRIPALMAGKALTEKKSAALRVRGTIKTMV